MRWSLQFRDIECYNIDHNIRWYGFLDKFCNETMFDESQIEIGDENNAYLYE